MKPIQYNRLQLRDAVRLASKALSSKPASVAEKCVRLHGDKVTGMNLTEACEVSGAGASGDGIDVLVNAADLLSRIEATSEETITLALDGWKLRIGAKKSKWTLDVFETLEKRGVKRPSNPMTVELGALRKGLDAVLPVAGTEPAETRYFGVQLLPDGRMVGTDGRRVHLFDGGPKVPTPTILTAQFAKIVAGLKVDTVQMSIDADAICVESPGVALSNRQLGTDFVPAAALIARVWQELGKEGSLATVASADFIAALEAASLAAEHQQVSLSVVDGMIVVVGRGSGDTSHCELMGSLVAVSASAPSLIAAVKACGSAKVDIRTSANIQVGIVVTVDGTPPGGPCAMVAPTIGDAKEAA